MWYTRGITRQSRVSHMPLVTIIYCNIVDCIPPITGQEKLGCGALYSIHLCGLRILTLPTLRLLSANAQKRKYFWKPSKPCQVGTHWITLMEYSQMSTHMPQFQWFYRIFALFCIANLATSSMRVKEKRLNKCGLFCIPHIYRGPWLGEKSSVVQIYVYSHIYFQAHRAWRK